MMDSYDFITLIPVGLSVILAILMYYYYWHFKAKFNLPPGPVGAPLVGYLPFLREDSPKQFKLLSEKYGKVFSLYLGRSLFIVLNDYESVKDAFNDPSLLDRPDKLFDFHPDGMGVSSCNGNDWTEQRKFVTRALKDITAGESVWEDHVQEECEEFTDWISSHEGQPVDIFQCLFSSVSSNITRFVLGKRLPLGDARRAVVNDAVGASTRSFGQASVISIFPVLMSFIADLGLTRFAIERKRMKTFNKLVRNEVATRKENLDSRSEDTFIDGYLNEINRMKQNNLTTHLSEQNLTANAQVLVFAGSETVTVSIFWLFLTMATHPEIQQRVQEEIDLVLGSDGIVKWVNRSKLPYTLATALEAQRWKTATPLNISHRAAKDTTISGYGVPKDTKIIANTWALHNDQRYWKDPEKFDPERFIMEDGNVMLKKPESFSPFSLGKRSCPGDLLAMTEILHYFIATMQKFRILPEENTLPNLEGMISFNNVPHPQALRYVSRSHFADAT